MSEKQDDREMLSPQQLAAELNVSVSALQAWRREGKGPRWLRVGGRIRYPRAWVREWLAEENPGIDLPDC